jgi:hypothetical protein
MELLLSALVKAGYLWSFFFWLDVLAALSLVPDIPYFWLPIIGLQADSAWISAAAVDRAAAVSDRMRALYRLERFVKLIRLVRIAKLFELCQRKAEEYSQHRKRATATASSTAVAADVDSHGVDGEDHPRPSQVGQHLSEQTTRKVVLLVLLMLFGIPLLQPHLEQHSEEYTLLELHALASSNLTLAAYDGPVYATTESGAKVMTAQAIAAANATMQEEVAWVRQHYRGDLLFLRLHGSFAPPLGFASEELHDHRTTEVRAVKVGSEGMASDANGSSEGSMALFSVRSATRRAGQYAMLTTMVVLVLLSIGAVLFNRNNHRMVRRFIRQTSLFSADAVAVLHFGHAD